MNLTNPGTPPKAFINCHTHTFTGDHVPPKLGRRLLPFPLGEFITITVIVRFFRWWYNGPGRIRQTKWYRAWHTRYHELRIFLKQYFVLNIINAIVSAWLTIVAVLILYYWIAKPFLKGSRVDGLISKFVNLLTDWSLLSAKPQLFLRIGIIVLVLLFIPSGRNFLYALFRLLLKFLRVLPGPKTKELFARYLTIGRFAFRHGQHTIYDALNKQYPLGTRFVVLPMDMDFMKAGRPRILYLQQLEELKRLRNNHPEHLLPFVFADPRRLQADKSYFDLLKDHIQHQGFWGIKIYPALGYYPFDEDLLPVLAWAAENNVPVLTHCIKGVIFYRGKKKKEWNYHEVFSQRDRKGPLQLFETKNVNFSTNFTHPLNYLCLVDETRLRKLVGQYYRKGREDLKILFGYENDEQPLRRNLSNLKLCFGHFGGEEEWLRYLQRDRYRPDNALNFHPETGINFAAEGGIEDIWRYASWYSIIYSLLLQYPNLYADISYTIHDQRVYNLLRSTLLPHSGIRDQVLFGTDFYVVRSNAADKQIWTDVAGSLSTEELNKIAVENPRRFLESGFRRVVD